MMNRIAALLALAGFAPMASAGCNTIEGAGRDAKAAGGAVEKAAAKNKTC